MKGSTYKMTVNEYLRDTFDYALEKLDESKSAESQVDDFLDTIGMPKSNLILRKAFVVACCVNRIGYKDIDGKIHRAFPDISEFHIMIELKNEFNKWLDQYPEIKEKYPNISIMEIIKIFTQSVHKVR